MAIFGVESVSGARSNWDFVEERNDAPTLNAVEMRVCLIFSVAACVHRKPEYSACSSRRHRKECVTALRVCLIFSFGCHREPENGDLILSVVAGVTGKSVSQR